MRARKIDEFGELEEYEPCDILAIDSAANACLQKLTEELTAYPCRFHEASVLARPGLPTFVPAERSGTVLFMLASDLKAAANIADIEQRCEFRKRYVTVLVVLVDETGNSATPLPTLPSTYHLLRLNHPQAHEQEFVDRLNKACLAVMQSLFGAGSVCVDPMDFVMICAGTEYLSWHQLEDDDYEPLAARIEDFADLQNPDILSVFLCLNVNYETQLEEGFRLAEALPESCETVAVSMPEYYMESREGYGAYIIAGHRNS